MAGATKTTGMALSTTNGPPFKLRAPACKVDCGCSTVNHGDATKALAPDTQHYNANDSRPAHGDAEDNKRQRRSQDTATGGGETGQQDANDDKVRFYFYFIFYPYL